MRKLEELEILTTNWAEARGIIKNGKAITQACKLFEEGGELASAVLKGKKDKVKDGIGDCLVVLNNIAKLEGTSLAECWNLAYEEIKDRKGYLNADGNFIKEADDNILIIIEEVTISTKPYSLVFEVTFNNYDCKVYEFREPKTFDSGIDNLAVFLRNFTELEMLEFLDSKNFKRLDNV